MTMQDIDDAVASLPSVKFPEVGSKVAGDVIDAFQKQVTDFETRRPATWDDGNPKMQWVITLRTDEGDVNWYLKPAAWQAIKAAVREAGGKLSEGGRLEGERTADEGRRHGFKAKFMPYRNVDQAIDAA